MTIEQRKKLSIAHLGQISWNKGKKYPQLCGKNHPNWKGGKNLRKDGYVIMSVNGGSILEHRYKMEKHIKRKLTKKEVVHHKNGNPSDNRINNLELISNNSKHMRLHRWDLGGKEKLKCPSCNSKFVDFKSNKRIFCSKKCYSNSQKGKKYEKTIQCKR